MSATGRLLASGAVQAPDPDRRPRRALPHRNRVTTVPTTSTLASATDEKQAHRHGTGRCCFHEAREVSPPPRRRPKAAASGHMRSRSRTRLLCACIHECGSRPARLDAPARRATLRECECRPRGRAAGHRDDSDRRARRWPDRTGAIAASPMQSPAPRRLRGECDRPRESRFPRGGGRWRTMGRCSSCSESRRTRTSLRCCRSSSSARCLLLLCDSSVSASPERRSCGAGRPPRGRWEETATLPITEVERSRVALGRMSACKSAVRCACLRPGVGPDPRRVDRAPPAVQVCLCA